MFVFLITEPTDRHSPTHEIFHFLHAVEGVVRLDRLRDVVHTRCALSGTFFIIRRLILSVTTALKFSFLLARRDPIFAFVFEGSLFEFT